MPITQQSKDQSLNKIALANDYLADFASNAINNLAFAPKSLVNFLYILSHLIFPNQLTHASSLISAIMELP